MQVDPHFHNDRGCRFGAIAVKDWFCFVYIIQKPKHALSAELIETAFQIEFFPLAGLETSKHFPP